jgi:hypothetical protein
MSMSPERVTFDRPFIQPHLKFIISVAPCSTGSQSSIVVLFSIRQRSGHLVGHSLWRGFSLSIKLVKGEDTSGVTE